MTKIAICNATLSLSDLFMNSKILSEFILIETHRKIGKSVPYRKLIALCHAFIG